MVEKIKLNVGQGTVLTSLGTGIDLGILAEYAGVTLTAQDKRKAIETLIENKYLTRTDTGFTLTEAGERAKLLFGAQMIAED